MTALVTSRPLLLNANTNVYGAWDQRSLAEGAPGIGVADRGSFKVLQRQLGAAMSVDVGASGVGLQRAWVRGTTREGQGLYLVDSIDRATPGSSAWIGQLNDTISTADASNPRIDRVVLEVLDQQHTAGGSNLAQIRVVPGTATVGATLDNLTGAALVPTSSILLADVLVGAAAASIVTANIRDRRARPLLGSAPEVFTDVDSVQLMPAPGLAASNMSIQSTASFNSQQAAALMYLPRRIKQATRIRLRYQQGGTANATAYVIAICDASGRPIVATSGTDNYTGTANQVVSASLTISATDFDPGYYWVFIGNASGTASGSVLGMAIGAGAGTGVHHIGSGPNQYAWSATGGVTVPATILGLTDQNTVSGAAATQRPGVPLVSLSVG